MLQQLYKKNQHKHHHPQTATNTPSAPSIYQIIHFIMLPATFSVKGYAAITFKDAKDNMGASTIWSTLMKIQKYYPEKLKLYFSSTRGGQDTTTNDDPLVTSAIMNMIKGCVDTCQIKESKGASISLLLGTCYEYKVPFGISSDDVGHRSIILTLPFPMAGCYMMSAAFEGSLKRGGSREYYMVDISLDIYIGQLSDEQYKKSLSQGIKVYPFKLNHPEYFPKADSSESEFTTEPSDDEDGEPPMAPRKRSKSPLSTMKKRGVMKKKKHSGVNRRLLDAFNMVAKQANTSPPKDAGKGQPGDNSGNNDSASAPE
nr:matrix protein [Tomato betanucleorhabdovirus 2]UYE93365.1 matrix protein [Tomato betanucleorhabdovirus 2]